MSSKKLDPDSECVKNQLEFPGNLLGPKPNVGYVQKLKDDFLEAHYKNQLHSMLANGGSTLDPPLAPLYVNNPDHLTCIQNCYDTLNTLLHVYADDCFEPDTVSNSKDKISKAGGIIAYTTNQLEEIRRILPLLHIKDTVK